MRTMCSLLMVSIAGSMCLSAWPQADDMAEAAQSFLELDEAGKASFEFDNEKERKDWSNLPARMHPRGGLGFGDMSEAQRIAAHRLLASGLSSQGYHKAAGVMRLDEIWKEIMEERSPGRGALFGSDKYWVAVFGKPTVDGAWGWQFDGHHLAINVTSVKGELSLMPMFFGAEPDIVPSGTYAGWQIFGAERKKALALVTSLTKKQRKQAILSEDIPSGIFEGPGDGGRLEKMEGITAADLTPEQNVLLWALIDEYLDNATTDVAAAHRARIVKDGDAKLHFAWMGPTQAGENIYFRVHGPSVLIEYDNTFVGPNRTGYSNHHHTILREPTNDFGEDLLLRHYQESNHH